MADCCDPTSQSPGETAFYAKIEADLEAEQNKPYLAAVAFIDYVLVDVAELIPDSIKTRWIAALAEKFVRFAGKD